jgi:hypothetical protein
MLAAGLPAGFVDPCRHTTNRPCAPACIHDEGFQLELPRRRPASSRGATAFAAVVNQGDRSYALRDGETVSYKRADSTFCPEYDSYGRRVTILATSMPRPVTEIWHKAPLGS